MNDSTDVIPRIEYDGETTGTKLVATKLNVKKRSLPPGSVVGTSGSTNAVKKSTRKPPGLAIVDDFKNARHPSFDDIVERSGEKKSKTRKVKSTLTVDKKRRAKKVAVTTVTWTLVAGLALGGAWAINYGLTPGDVVETMPLPEVEISVEDTEAIEIAEATDLLTDSKDKQRLAKMLDELPNNSAWIPDTGAVAPLISESGFESSNYNGYQTLTIPDNPQQAAWFNGGGSLWGQNEGTTLLAAHVATANNRGVFYGIHERKAGDVVWTKDGEGNLQAWSTKRVWFANHTAFPDEYFASDGQRQLVITTCGGRINAQGYFAQNVFLVAVPFDHELGDVWEDVEANDAGETQVDEA